MGAGRYDGLTRRELIAAVGAGVFTLMASGCLPRPPLVHPGIHTVDSLKGAQIRVYQGEQLSSIADSRENSIKGPQYIERAKWSLTVDGMVDTPMTYSFDRLLATFPSDKQVRRLECVEGWGVTQLWEGIRIVDVLAKSAVQPAATTVIFHASDGYTTSFPVDYFTREHLLVHELNAVDLPAERGGPLRLGAWSKWGYKWIRWIERIELSDDSDYRGYWESRGYDNDAELSEAP